jgi:hypothetical protein
VAFPRSHDEYEDAFAALVSHAGPLFPEPAGRRAHVADVVPRWQAGEPSEARYREWVGLPVRYRRVADIAGQAVDRSGFERFDRLGARWARGELTLDQFATEMERGALQD